MNRKEPQPLSATYVVQDGKNGSIQKGRNPPRVVVKKLAPPSPPPKAKSK